MNERVILRCMLKMSSHCLMKGRLSTVRQKRLVVVVVVRDVFWFEFCSFVEIQLLDFLGLVRTDRRLLLSLPLCSGLCSGCVIFRLSLAFCVSGVTTLFFIVIGDRIESLIFTSSYLVYTILGKVNRSSIRMYAHIESCRGWRFGADLDRTYHAWSRIILLLAFHGSCDRIICLVFVVV